MSAVPAGAAIAREWRRFTPRQRLTRYAFYLFAVAALAQSVRSVDVIPEFLEDMPEQVVDLFARMWPVDWNYYPATVHAALVETLHIATLGTILSLALAFPVGIMAARNIVRWPAVQLFAKFILVSSRSVNSLVWALLFVAVFGPGALAGTLAIAFRSIGFVGKLLGEALEEAHRGPVEALTAAGASPASVFLKAYWPQVQPSFWSIALFRLDINIRESAVLGLVGAGGIGTALDDALSLLYWDQVAMTLLTIFAVVIVAEIAVTYIRSRIL